MPDAKFFATARRRQWTELPNGYRVTLIDSSPGKARLLFVSPDGVETTVETTALTAPAETGKMNVPVIAGVPSGH